MFVLLCHDLLRVFFLEFVFDPGAVSVVGVRSWVIVVEGFAVDRAAGDGVCESGVT